jgi:chromatin modification-related protein VID21
MPPQAQIPGQMPNGRIPNPIMNGVPQAQMQGMPAPAANLGLNVGLISQAQSVAEQQRQHVRMQQAGQIPVPGQNGQIQNSPPRNMNGFNQMTGNMMPFNPTPNGVGSPGQSHLQHGQAGSPRMGHPQSLSNGLVPHAIQLETIFRQKYPNSTPEQITRMVSESLSKSAASNQRQGLAQSAMNAAAGGNMNGIGNMNGGPPRMPTGVENTPQMYAQMLRQQQQDQQKNTLAAHAQAQAQAQAQQNQQTLAVAAQQGSNGHQRSGSATSGK